MTTPRHQLFRVIDSDGNLYRAPDGRTRFPDLAAGTIAARIGGKAIR